MQIFFIAYKGKERHTKVITLKDWGNEDAE
jgi:hypothetical protein